MYALLAGEYSIETHKTAPTKIKLLIYQLVFIFSTDKQYNPQTSKHKYKPYEAKKVYDTSDASKVYAKIIYIHTEKTASPFKVNVPFLLIS